MDAKHIQNFLEDSIPELTEYILSDTLYWQINSGYVPLTIGNLLIENKILSAIDSAASEKFGARIDVTRQKWTVNWQMKAEKEIRNRLRLWTDFLTHSHADGKMPLAYYKTNVRHRAILTLLEDELSSGIFKNEIMAADSLLRSIEREKGFIWEAGLKSAFPEQTYWFLY